MDADAGHSESSRRKTRKIRISDDERDVLIRTLEDKLEAAATDDDRATIRTLLEQIRPKRRRSSQRLVAAFHVQWTDAGGAEETCGHSHVSHLEASNCAQQLASRGVEGQIVPVVSAAE